MKNVKRLFMVSMILILAFVMSACKTVSSGAELSINSDGTGTRKIITQVPKNDNSNSNGSTSDCLLKHGEELQSWLINAYAENVAGSEAWLTVSVDNSGADAEIITLSFDFTSLEEYKTRLQALAFHTNHVGKYQEPVITMENDKIVYYEENTDVIESIIFSIRDVIEADSSVYKTNGSSISEGFLEQTFVAGTEYHAVIDGKEAIALTGETNKTLAWCAAGCSEAYDVRLTVETADEWTSLLRQYGKTTTSWLGADGIFAVALDGVDSFGSATADTKTLFMFNDTLIGTSDADGNCIFEGMPQNTAALLEGVSPDLDKIEFIWGQNGTNPTDSETLNNEEKRNLLGGKFWNGDCLVLNDTLYITATHVVGGITQDYVSVFAVPIVNGEPDWTNVTEQSEVSQLYYKTSDGRDIQFVAAIYANTTEAEAPNPDEYIYMYGTGSGYEMYVARIHKDDFPGFEKLTYWTGTEWSTDKNQCVSLKKEISAALSVSYIPVGPYAGKYMAVWMESSISGNLMYAIGDSLAGPFGPSIALYNPPESDVAVIDRNGNLTSMFVYNPVAYPHLSSGDKLLISYNVNVYSGDNETYTYTPRFLWVDLDPVDYYDYTVEYYYDGVKDDTKTETKSAEYGKVITDYTDKVQTGYELDKVEGIALTISEDETANVIKVYYVTVSEGGSENEGGTEDGTGSENGSGTESGTGNEGGSGNEGETGNEGGNGNESGSGNESGTGSGTSNKAETIIGTVTGSGTSTRTDTAAENTVTSPKTGDNGMPGSIMAALIMGSVLIIGGILVRKVRYKKNM